MLTGEFVTGIDLVDILLALFVVFFLGLVLYLQREGMREGYPLESDDTLGRKDTATPVFYPQPKTFKLMHGRGDLTYSYGPRDTRELALKRSAPWPGAPYVPTGDPMADGVGPASYAERADYPDLTLAGEPRIAPYRVSPGYTVPKEDADPRGMTVFGADGERAGEVVDLWVDRSEAILRYFEVAVDGTGDVPKRVLLPVPFAVKKGGRAAGIHVEAILAAHFAKVPVTKDETSITRLEEDRISGFYGGGKLYATAARQEPVL
ncbi:MAG: photosynthetic reaction center subunit H [Pseudomonadota bacterium]